ncbi:NAD-glutamate dehydrogenase, partial [Streptomyces sp. tea 10]|nr:NAD-glutamate dehydrogenase [Streptomyces sp. tea 10]
MTFPQATTQAIPTVWQRPRWSAEQAWLNEYYRSVPDADMVGTDQQVLTERAESHREVGRSRRTDELCIEVREDHGDTVLYMVTTDMPFLVSTLTTEIAANWGGAKLVLHPLLLAARDSEDVLRSLGEIPNISAVSSGDTTSIPITDELVGGAAGGRSHTAVESWIRVELHRTLDEQARGELARHIEALVADVRRVAEDQEAMLEQTRRIADSLAPLEDITFEDGSRLPDVGASQEFLEWLRGGNFVFMGIKRYDLEVDGEDAVLHSRPDTGLGLLREQGTEGHAQKLTGLGSAHARDHQVVFVTKANRRSSIHRREYLDYIGVRTFAENGDVDGEYLILGLFSRHAYSVPAQQTPLVREKVQRVVERFGFLPDSHSARDLMGIIEDYPRDELF